MSLSVFSAAAEAPGRLALVTDAVEWTYGDLAAGVRPVVGRLRARGLAGDRPVALSAANDPDTAVLIHALIALGTPALLLHPRLTGPEREGLLAAAGDPPVLRSSIRGTAGAAPGAGGSGTHAPAPDPPVPPVDERPLAIVHTSGSSGRPRGVVLSRRAFAASAAASAENLGWRADDRWLLPLPLAHVGGLSILTRCLLGRRTVVMVPAARPEGIVDAVLRHRVTLLSLVPTMLRRILALDPPVRPPDHLRAVLLGGAAASPALLERAADRGWPVLTTYGLSEACSQVTTQRYGTVNRGEAGSGPALPGVELRIGDDDAIHVRGPTLFSRYVPPDPADPFLPDGWFPTGDQGRLDDRGNLHVLGRRTDRIVTGGENVDPVEVEQALESLERVRAACVFGLPDPEWGEVVCAAVVADRSRSEVEAAVASLRGRLAPFKLPRRLALVEDLPRNRTGKVDRNAAARSAAQALEPLEP